MVEKTIRPSEAPLESTQVDLPFLADTTNGRISNKWESLEERGMGENWCKSISIWHTPNVDLVRLTHPLEEEFTELHFQKA